ncbi:CehA/McbA family metallohydrolase [Streptomyces uncialis]|uniref:CehA/McbA family metallohydrolase n=1 Tax=Streptomyces uncialis TaxID=1048205 RepID=UPI003787957B
MDVTSVGGASAFGRRAFVVTGGAVSLGWAAGGVAGAEGGAGAEARSRPGVAPGTGDRVTWTIRGTLPPGAPDYVYLPVDVPSGVRELRVAYRYDRPVVAPGTAGNALDIGLFGTGGVASGGAGFRGWSGGARTEFFVRGDDATPGYLPGPVDAGRWHIVLSPYTVAPGGLTYEVRVTLVPGPPAAPVPDRRYPPQRARGRGRDWYRGDCHLHTWYSDGRRTPEEVAALARAAGLDFINSSEHNTHAGHRHWAGAAGDDLLVMLGEEVTTRNGHVLAIGTDPGTFVDWRYRARDNRFGRYAGVIRRAGGLVVPAHPHATCVGCAWKYGFAEADAVEVWNGAYGAEDEAALAEWDNALVTGVRGGRRGWLPAMGGSDAHRDPEPVGRPQTVVLADDLTRVAVQEGIRAGRSYVAESASVRVDFSLVDGRGRRAGIGERLTVGPDAAVTAQLTASGVPGCTVRFVTDRGALYTSPVVGPSGEVAVRWTTTSSYAAYVRAEIRHPSGAPGGQGPSGPLAAFTNPVFLDPPP